MQPNAASHPTNNPISLWWPPSLDFPLHPPPSPRSAAVCCVSLLIPVHRLSFSASPPAFSPLFHLTSGSSHTFFLVSTHTHTQRCHSHFSFFVHFHSFKCTRSQSFIHSLHLHHPALVSLRQSNKATKVNSHHINRRLPCPFTSVKYPRTLRSFLSHEHSNTHYLNNNTLTLEV